MCKATASDFVGEPRLEDLLAEPIVAALAKADGVAPSQLRTIVDSALTMRRSAEYSRGD